MKLMRNAKKMSFKARKLKVECVYSQLENAVKSRGRGIFLLHALTYIY